MNCELVLSPFWGPATISFCGAVYAVGLYGLTGLACRQLPRTLASGEVCCPVGISRTLADPQQAYPISKAEAQAYAMFFFGAGVIGVGKKYQTYSDSIQGACRLVEDDARWLNISESNDYQVKIDAIRNAIADYIGETNVVCGLGWECDVSGYAEFCAYPWDASNMFSAGPVPPGWL